MSPLDNNAPSEQSKSSRGAAAQKDEPRSDRRHPSSKVPQPAGSGSSRHNSSLPDNRYCYPDSSTYMSHSRHGTQPSTLSMSDMRSSLPAFQPHTVYFDQHPTPQHFIPTNHPHGMLYPMQPVSPFPGTTANTNMTFSASFTNAYPPYYQQQSQQHSQHPPHHHHHHHNAANSPDPSGYSPQGTDSSTRMEVPPVSQCPGYTHSYYVQNVYTTSLGLKQNLSNASGLSKTHAQPSHLQSGLPKNSAAPDLKPRIVDSDYDVAKTIVDGSTPMRSAPILSSSTDSSMQRNIADLTAVRGPPRKPKQSGHALWVGNLPPGTNIVDLKDFFSRDATKDVESVFLISKSNCAFINYKSEMACLAALSRFHDSRFQGARLVCRLRRGVMAPAPSTDTLGGSGSTPLRGIEGDEDVKPTSNGEGAVDQTLARDSGESRHLNTWVPNRYFVVKSLTLEDLELSRQSGIWATQSHNEKVLNHAFETADNVYLIFSANKSGEYYGYARMMSPIQEDDNLILEAPSRPENAPTEPENLDVTVTPATITAPNGRIINDPARGTTFWEADTSSEDEAEMKSEKSAGGDPAEEPTESGFQSIGSPFRIQWCSIERVPFHRTRGLRNPWNANREVKIARDGTEIEPTIGERLVHLFHATHIG